jgi:hypothetical protein
MRFKAMKRNPTSEDTIVRLMSNHAKKKGYKEILSDVLEERRIRDQKSRQINFCPDYDGTCKTSYNISATETCRSSTGILKSLLDRRKLGSRFILLARMEGWLKISSQCFVPGRVKFSLRQILPKLKQE